MVVFFRASFAAFVASAAASSAATNPKGNRRAGERALGKEDVGYWDRFLQLTESSIVSPTPAPVFSSPVTAAPTRPPVMAPGTMAPVEVPATVAPVEVPATMAPVEVPATMAPVMVPGTMAPVMVPGTMAPVMVPGTMAPVMVPGTMAPVMVPGTMAPVEVPATMAPVEVPATMAPVEVPATMAPVMVPGTMPPGSQVPTNSPVEGGSTAPPSTAPVMVPGTMAPVMVPGTMAPVMVPGTMAPVMVPGTMAPVLPSGTMGPTSSCFFEATITCTDESGVPCGSIPPPPPNQPELCSVGVIYTYNITNIGDVDMNIDILTRTRDGAELDLIGDVQEANPIVPFERATLTETTSYDVCAAIPSETALLVSASQTSEELCNRVIFYQLSPVDGTLAPAQSPGTDMPFTSAPFSVPVMTMAPVAVPGQTAPPVDAGPPETLAPVQVPATPPPVASPTVTPGDGSTSAPSLFCFLDAKVTCADTNGNTCGSIIPPEGLTGEGCLVDVLFTYTMENIGDIDLQITELTRTREGMTEDLFDRVSGANPLAPGNVVSIGETATVDVCLEAISRTTLSASASRGVDEVCQRIVFYELNELETCQVSMNTDCVSSDGTPCDEFEILNGQCTVGSNITALSLKYTGGPCSASIFGVTCQDFDGGATGQPIEIFCAGPDGRVLGFAVPLLVDQIATIVPDKKPGLEELKCTISDLATGVILQTFEFDASPTSIIGLGDQLGATTVFGCSDAAGSALNCSIPIMWSFTATNIGDIDATLTSMSITQAGSTIDLSDQITTPVLTPGATSVATVDQVVDLCMPVALDTTARVEAEPDCFGEFDYVFTLSVAPMEPAP